MGSIPRMSEAPAMTEEQAKVLASVEGLSRHIVEELQNLGFVPESLLIRGSKPQDLGYVTADDLRVACVGCVAQVVGAWISTEGRIRT